MIASNYGKLTLATHPPDVLFLAQSGVCPGADGAPTHSVLIRSVYEARDEHKGKRTQAKNMLD